MYAAWGPVPALSSDVAAGGRVEFSPIEGVFTHDIERAHLSVHPSFAKLTHAVGCAVKHGIHFRRVVQHYSAIFLGSREHSIRDFKQKVLFPADDLANLVHQISIRYEIG